MITVWDSIHAQSFMRDICDTLASGREHCAILMPKSFHDGFIKKLLTYAEYRLGPVLMARPGPENTAFETLQPAFCIGDNATPRDCKDLAHLMTRDGNLLLVRCPEQECVAQKEICEFAEEARALARVCKTANTPLPSRVAFLLTPNTHFPEQDMGFVHHHWWGKLYASDLEYMIEEELRPMNLSAPAWHWFYSLCKGLCQAGPDLVKWIIHNAPANVWHVKMLLSKHPYHTRQNAEIVNKVLEHGAHSQLTRMTIPVGICKSAWEAGILDMSASGQAMLHPAALLAAGREDLILKQILAGQLQTYFPIVQDVIHLIHRRFVLRFGTYWYGREEDKVQEIGGLLNFINNELVGNAEVAQERDLAYCWWQIRTALAHYSLIPIESALKSIALYSKMRDINRPDEEAV